MNILGDINILTKSFECRETDFFSVKSNKYEVKHPTLKIKEF